MNKQSKAEVSTNPSKSPRPILEVMREFQAKHPDKCWVVDPCKEKWVCLDEANNDQE